MAWSRIWISDAWLGHDCVLRHGRQRKCHGHDGLWAICSVSWCRARHYLEFNGDLYCLHFHCNQRPANSRHSSRLQHPSWRLVRHDVGWADFNCRLLIAAHNLRQLYGHSWLYRDNLSAKLSGPWNHTSRLCPVVCLGCFDLFNVLY